MKLPRIPAIVGSPTRRPRVAKNAGIVLLPRSNPIVSYSLGGDQKRWHHTATIDQSLSMAEIKIKGWHPTATSRSNPMVKINKCWHHTATIEPYGNNPRRRSNQTLAPYCHNPVLDISQNRSDAGTILPYLDRILR